jgi:hypothetical protein
VAHKDLHLIAVALDASFDLLFFQIFDASDEEERRLDAIKKIESAKKALRRIARVGGRVDP